MLPNAECSYAHVPTAPERDYGEVSKKKQLWNNYLPERQRGDDGKLAFEDAHDKCRGQFILSNEQ